MPPKHDISLPRHCPYNISEVKNAAACLKNEVERGSIGFLQRRLTFAQAGLCGNVWEGEDGFMDHITGSFPMPEKVNNVEENSDTSNVGHCSSSALANVNSKPSTEGNLNSKRSKLSSSSSSSTVLRSANSLKLRDRVNGNHTIFDSEDDDCVILEEEKVGTDSEEEKDNSSNNNTSNEQFDSVMDSQVPSVSSSENDGDLNGGNLNDDVKHWERLFQLYSDIMEAKLSLDKIIAMFSQRSQVKACEGIGPLRGQIIDLIKRLRQAKNDIDNRNFSEILSPGMRTKHFNRKPYSRKISSYTDIWSLFKSLCDKFVSTRTKWKQTLVEHNCFQTSSISVESNVKM